MIKGDKKQAIENWGFEISNLRLEKGVKAAYALIPGGQVQGSIGREEEIENNLAWEYQKKYNTL